MPHAPHIAVTAEPWPGNVAVYRSASDNGYRRIDRVSARSIIGVTETELMAAPVGKLDRGAALRVKLSSPNTLFSVSTDDLLNGANVLAIGDGSPENWEILQFATADLVGEQTYDLSLRLRGQLGTDATMPSSWPVGSYVVVLDGAQEQIPLRSAARGLNRHYRIGPARKAYTDESYVHVVYGFNGIGLRPYAPVHLTARDDGGDHQFSWIRRTRIDGDPWSETEVPLGEVDERYRLRIRDGATVLREVDVTSPSWSYIAALRSADMVPGSYTVEVAQVSERFGPGPYAQLQVTL